MKRLIFYTFLITATGCADREIITSAIEVRRFDPGTIDRLKEESDSSFMEIIGQPGIYSARHFVNYRDSSTTKILKDEDGNVIGMIRTKNNEVIKTEEYFPNGQLKASIPQPVNGEIEGIVKYYYEDGRVRSEGMYKNAVWQGPWKNYDSNGKLLYIYEYDHDGQIIKTSRPKFD